MTSVEEMPLAAPVRIVWSREMLEYDFGQGHPMTSERLDLTVRLAQDLGLFDGPGVELTGADVASDELLATVHDPDYIAAVHRASADGTLDIAHGLGTDDDPVFPRMHEATARVVQGSVDSALAVWTGRVAHAVNVTGGLHHAMPAAASGFCVYNDAAVAIRALLDAGAQRVAYVDVDAHHGDGVQAVFWDEPRVLTVSIHETGIALFPGTGHARETGGPGADGSAVNIALPSGTGDAGWLRAIDAVVPAVVRAFAPDVLVTQHGCDTHVSDPLTHLRVSLDGQLAATRMMHELAHQVAGGRWLALGGGGYAVVDVVPRSWAHLIGVATHQPVDPATPLPEAWLALVQERYGRRGPERMTDGRDARFSPWTSGYDPGDDVDRAIRATRAAVFPTLGLDAELD